jgi:hypothetical protein
VLRLPKPPRLPGAIGRPLKHGPEFALSAPSTWPEPVHTTITETTRYGTATASSWDRVHLRLTHRGCWLAHTGALPVIEGTVVSATWQMIDFSAPARLPGRWVCHPAR